MSEIPSLPSLKPLEDVVAPRILSAMKAASAQLTSIGVRHILIGGLAVGAWGYARATKDIDFLVGDEAFEFRSGDIVTLLPGVPISVEGVAIHPLGILQHETNLEAALSRPVVVAGLPVAPLESLIYLNLGSNRHRDLADIVELLRIHDPRPVRRYLEENAPDMLSRFDALAKEAHE